MQSARDEDMPFGIFDFDKLNRGQLPEWKAMLEVFTFHFAHAIMESVVPPKQRIHLAQPAIAE